MHATYGGLEEVPQFAPLLKRWLESKKFNEMYILGTDDLIRVEVSN